MDVKPGHALIEVRKNKPAGVFKNTWYTVDAHCHGCWHGCNSGHPIDDIAKIDEIVKKEFKNLTFCKDWKEKPKIKIDDFREKQQTL